MCLQLSNSPRQNAEGYVGQREFGWFRAKMRLVGCEIMLGENAFGWVRGFWVISEVRLVGWVRGHEDLWGAKKNEARMD